MFRSLPASPEAVAGFLAHEAEAGRSASTVGRRLAAISYGYKLTKAANPTDDEGVRATMKGIRQDQNAHVIALQGSHERLGHAVALRALQRHHFRYQTELGGEEAGVGP